jgi:GlpG protein
MRTVGNLASDAAARRLSDILYVEGIENQVDAEDDGSFSIWVLDDEGMVRGAELFQQFKANPEAPEFRDTSTRARQQRARESRAAEARRSTVADTARIGYEREFRGVAYVPLILIVLCVAVAIYSRFGVEARSLEILRISNYERDAPSGRWLLRKTNTNGMFLAEVRAGQVWRLVTPALLHFTLLHLVFNMFMLRDLGTFLENRLGTPYLAVLVIVLAILSNIGQLAWSGDPNFGGMSGVVYGLFGFWWIRGKFDRYANWSLNKTTVQILLIWYVLCLTNLISSVANAAHTVGLVVGMAWGYLSARK